MGFIAASTTTLGDDCRPSSKFQISTFILVSRAICNSLYVNGFNGSVIGTDFLSVSLADKTLRAGCCQQPASGPHMLEPC